MSKILDLASRDIQDKALRYLSFMECELDIHGYPRSCTLVKSSKDNEEELMAFATFLEGSQATYAITFMILEHVSAGPPEEEFERLKFLTRELQQKVSSTLYPESHLFEWALEDGLKWVDRSLKVVGDPVFDKMMYGRDGFLKMKNIFVHANYQYIYNCALDILIFMSSRP